MGTFTLEEMADELAEATKEYGFSDFGAENLNDRMRDAGIPKSERFALLQAAHRLSRELR